MLNQTTYFLQCIKFFLNHELPRTPKISNVVTNVYATTKVIAVEYAITYLLLTLQFQNKVKVPVDLQGCLSETTWCKRRF